MAKTISALVAYDCGSENLQITTVSLVDPPECGLNTTNMITESINIAVTQTARNENADYLHCSILVKHFVYSCGFLYDSNVENGFYTELLRVSREECKQLNTRGTIKVYGTQLEGLMGKDFRTITTWGTIKNGKCKTGGDLSINGHVWVDAVRTSEITVLYGKGQSIADIESDKLLLSSGVSCPYKLEECYHPELGDVFWKVPVPVCDENNALVYRGVAHLTKTTLSDGRNSSYIHVITNKQDFQLSMMPRTTRVCGFLSYYTEHPSLFITILHEDTVDFPLKTAEKSPNVDMTLYVNSKFVHVVRHIEQQIEKLFNTLMVDRCLTHMKVSENMMTLATVNPEGFAYQYFGGPGYTSVIRGEVVHISRCKPVYVQPDVVRDCYDELPVNYKNKTRFMRPRSRILTNIGTSITCSPQLPPMYKVDGKWYSPTTHGLMISKNPEVISIEPLSYKFEPINNLASGGLYSEESLKNMERTLMSPISESVIQARLVKSISGGHPLPEGYSIQQAMSREDIESLGNEIVGWFPNLVNRTLGYGNYISSLLGVYLGLKIIAHIISSVLNFSVLRKDFDTLVALLFCWCDGLYHHVMDGRIIKKTEPNTEEAELRPFRLV